ncbi:MAG: SAM-dependent methyltransferase, partial [Cyanobacteria bacterium J06639_18]
ELFKKTGFKTSVDFVEYPLSIPKDRYIRMVENRYMSLLSSFDDKEIQEGVFEIEQKYSDKDILEFNDRFVCIVGEKS